MDKKVASYSGLTSCADGGRTMGQHLASRLVELGVDRGELHCFLFGGRATATHGRRGLGRSASTGVGAARPGVPS